MALEREFLVEQRTFIQGEAQQKLDLVRRGGGRLPFHFAGHELHGDEVVLRLGIPGRGKTLFELKTITVNREGLTDHNALLLAFKSAFPDNPRVQNISHAVDLSSPGAQRTVLQFNIRNDVTTPEGEVINSPRLFTSVTEGSKQAERVAKAVAEGVQSHLL